MPPWSTSKLGGSPVAPGELRSFGYLDAIRPVGESNRRRHVAITGLESCQKRASESAPSMESAIKIKKRKPAIDRLGKMVSAHTRVFELSSSWEEFVQAIRGSSHIHPNVWQLPHAANYLLHHYRKTGVPVLTSDCPWPQHKVDEAAQRGPHGSANQHAQFVHDEFASFAEKRVLGRSTISGSPDNSQPSAVPSRGGAAT